MRFPRSRKTTAVAKSKTNYSIYASWYDCILDFGLYLDGINRSFTKKNGRPTQSDQEMVRYLYGIYNTNVRWRNDVLKVLEKIQDANQPAVPIQEYNDPALSIPSDN
jgi:hypothetical protein